MSWANQSKSTSSFSNQSKSSSSFSNVEKSSSIWNIISYLLCENEDPLVQENNFYILLVDSAGNKHYCDYSNGVKNTSEYSNQSKN